MKRRTDKGLIILLLLANVLFGYGGWYVGEQEGKERGYEEANSQNMRMCFTRAKALSEAAYRDEIELGREYVRVFGAKIDSLRNELIECGGF